MMNTQYKYEICILGSANSDLFLQVKEFPKEGETISALVKNLLHLIYLKKKKNQYIKNGGKGANQAVASALLGSSSVFAGQIGRDELGKRLVAEMKQSGLSLEGLRELENVQTGQAIILLNEVGQNSIIIIGGANMHYDVLAQLPIEYENVLDQSQFLQLQMEIPQTINTLAAERMKHQDKLVMLDCGGKADVFSKELLEALTFVSPNETELERILQEQLLDYSDAHLEHVVKDKLLAKYPDLIVILKLGTHGSYLISKELSIRQQTISNLNPQLLEDFKIVDTVGAGDCFTSAFCSQLFRRANQFTNSVTISSIRALTCAQREEIFKDSLLFATASAFLCITKYGAMPSLPAKEEVDQIIKKYIINSI